MARQPVGLTAMRGHTWSAHSVSIAEYKDKFGNHRAQIIQMVYHKCGLCQEVASQHSTGLNINFHFFAGDTSGQR